MPRTRSTTDIELNNIPLMLYRTPSNRPGTDYNPVELEWGFGTVDAASRVQTQVVPRRWRDWSGGMGYAKQPGDPEETGVYHYGENVCTRFPGVVTPGGLLTPVALPENVVDAPSAAFELQGHLYFICGRYVVQLADGLGTPHVVQDFGAAFRGASATIFRGQTGDAVAIVGGTTGGLPAHIWQFNGIAWVQSTTVSGKFVETVKWVAGGVSAERLIVTDTLQSFMYTGTELPDPLDLTVYSSSHPVCGPAHQIRSLGRFPERIFFACDDGVRDAAADDTGTVQVRNLTPYWAKQPSPDNGAYALADRNFLYTTFANGLDRIDVTNLQRQDAPQWCDVGAYISNESPIFGTGPLALDRGWVVQAKYDLHQGKTHVMYAIDRRETGRDGVGPLVWHGSEATIGPEAEVHADRVPRFLYVASPNGDPRMWISAQASTVPYLAWLSLPRAQSPLQDYLNRGPMRFSQEGRIFSSAETWGAAGDRKTLQWFTLQSRYLGGGALIELWANAEHGDYIGQGVARRSPRTRVTPRGDVVNGYTIGTEVVLRSNPTVPAVLEELSVFAEVNADLAEQRRYPVVIARGNRTRTPAVEYRIPENTWRLVQPLQQAGPVILKDEIGELLEVSVQPGIGGKTIEDEDGNGWTRIASLVMTVLSSAGGRILHYGIGERWAAGYVWGAHALPGEVLHYGVGMTFGQGYIWGGGTTP